MSAAAAAAAVAVGRIPLIDRCSCGCGADEEGVRIVVFLRKGFVVSIFTINVAVAKKQTFVQKRNSKSFTRGDIGQQWVTRG